MKHVPSCAARVPIFRDLPEQALEMLGDSMLHRRYARGESVLASGEPVECLIVVADGRLKLAYLSPSGREQVVRTIGPGEFLGELALFMPVRQEEVGSTHVGRLGGGSDGYPTIPTQ